MTDASFPHILPAQTPRETVELPQPVPFSTPVLIGDCVTPLAGETILSLLWKRLDQSDT